MKTFIGFTILSAVTNMSFTSILPNGKPKSAIATGSAHGIGAQTIRSYHSAGCNFVIADLPSTKDTAETMISSLSDPKRVMYHPTDTTSWNDVRAPFSETKNRFGCWKEHVAHKVVA